MKCQKCNEEIGLDDISINLVDGEIYVHLDCPKCESNHWIYLEDKDFKCDEF